MISPNTILRERYRIIHLLGQGGMGAVYLAMDETLSCEVAVKETFATSDEQRRAFRREAQLLANLHHPTLPRVMDHFTHGDGQFLVMQFVPGHDLAELLELREQPFAVAKVMDWADQILDALEELHSSKPPIVHRDIKPANLKVTPRGRILLLDFGLAKGTTGQMSTVDADTDGKSIYGYTPNYAPIEQVRGAGTDPRSDLYALAATLWTLLTGKVPPDAVTRMAETGEGKDDPLVAAHKINSQVPASVSSVLSGALAVNRNRRLESAVEMRNALRAACDADVEHKTIPIEERPKGAPGAVESPRVASTVRAPDPPAPPPPLAPTIPVARPEIGQPVSSAPSVETIRVDSRPDVPSFNANAATPTAESIPPQEIQQSSSAKGLMAIVAAVVSVAAIGITLAIWRPWSSPTKLSLSNGSQDNSAHPTSSTTNSSLSNAAPAGMVFVPGGTFMMGRKDGDEYERPAHQVTVAPFFIDVYEVTNEDYDKFVKATSHKAPQTWQNGMYSAADARKPVTGVTWDDANDFAGWAGKRLPTEGEWEFAARGPENRIYPWGNDWRDGNANANGAKKSLTNVGEYKGASPFGTLDMVGNAWEWTATNLKAYPGGTLPPDQRAGDPVIRGGSYESSRDNATTTYRTGWPARGAKKYDQTGFRCVKDIAK